jgi:F-type H+-transporting ATPase subunit b
LGTFLISQSIFLAEDAGNIVGRVFGLDAQLLVDTLITACAMLFLFTLLSFLVFNPARELLRKRQEKVMNDFETAAKDKEEAAAFKAEYETKLANAHKDADYIIVEGRIKAMQQHEKMVEDAEAEAARIMNRAEKEIELEREKAKDDVRKEIIDVASVMAGRFVAESMTEARQEELAREVIDGMGKSTWQ